MEVILKSNGIDAVNLYLLSCLIFSLSSGASIGKISATTGTIDTEILKQLESNITALKQKIVSHVISFLSFFVSKLSQNTEIANALLFGSFDLFQQIFSLPREADVTDF